MAKIDESKPVYEQIPEKTRKRLDSAATWAIVLAFLLALAVRIALDWMRYHPR